jgi:hypothetical protein
MTRVAPVCFNYQLHSPYSNNLLHSHRILSAKTWNIVKPLFAMDFGTKFDKLNFFLINKNNLFSKMSFIPRNLLPSGRNINSYGDT